MEVPRVNSSMLRQYVGRLVCLVGKIEQVCEENLPNLCTLLNNLDIPIILIHKAFFIELDKA